MLMFELWLVCLAQNVVMLEGLLMGLLNTVEFVLLEVALFGLCCLIYLLFGGRWD